MKNLLRVSLVLLLAASALPSRAFEIARMDVDIHIARNSSFAVTETIAADFGQEPKHGIFRDILVQNPDRYGSSRRIRVHVTGVRDGQGNKRPYKAFRTGRYLRVKIGDPNSTCLLYTSDAADDLLCVDLGGRRIIKKKKQK